MPENVYNQILGNIIINVKSLWKKNGKHFKYRYLKPNIVKARWIILWKFLLCVFKHILITFLKTGYICSVCKFSIQNSFRKEVSLIHRLKIKTKCKKFLELEARWCSCRQYSLPTHACTSQGFVFLAGTEGMCLVGDIRYKKIFKGQFQLCPLLLEMGLIPQDERNNDQRPDLLKLGA